MADESMNVCGLAIEEQNNIVPFVDDKLQNMTKKLSDLSIRSNELRNLRYTIQTVIEEIQSLLPEYSKIKTHSEWNPGISLEGIQMNTTEKNKIEFDLRTKYQTVADERNKWYEEAKFMVQQLVIEQTTVIEELNTWKCRQKLSDCDDNLGLIQECFQHLAQILWEVKLTIDYFNDGVKRLPTKGPESENLIPRLQNTTQGLLNQLIKQSFVIVKQPPQVMKITSKFHTEVRLLIGASLGIQTKPPSVIASFVSEGFAKDLMMNTELQGEAISEDKTSGTLINNTAPMEHNRTEGTLSANFQVMQLNKIRDRRKNKGETVLEDKSGIVFQAKITIADHPFTFFALSLPIVAICNVSQEPSALKTITWDTASAQSERLPFVVSQEITWKEVAYSLSIKFRQCVGTSLTPEALDFLAMKAFRLNNNINGQDLNQLVLSWSLFAKELLPNREFTFWDWFYNTLKVSCQYLKTLWQKGAILGFVERGKSEQLLSTCPAGTFIVRFSDSQLGGVSICFVTKNDSYPSGLEVLSTSPMTKIDFEARGLADSILDLNSLTNLWTPSGLVPKDQKFERNPPKKSNSAGSNGYKIIPRIITTIEGINNVTLEQPTSSSQMTDPNGSNILNEILEAFNTDTYDHGTTFEIDFPLLDMER